MKKVILSLFFCMLAGAFSASGVCVRGDQPHPRYLDAVALFGEGKYDEASAILDSLYNSPMRDDAVCYYLGMSEFARGNETDAETHIEEAVAADSLNLWYLEALASIYESKSKGAELAAVCERMLAVDSERFNDPAFYSRLGGAYAASHNLPKAKYYLDKALDMLPDYTPANYSRALVSLEERNFDGFFKHVNILMADPEMDSDWKLKFLSSIPGEVLDGKVKSRVDAFLDLTRTAIAADPDNMKFHLFLQSAAAYCAEWPVVVEEAYKIIEMSGNDQDTRESMLQMAGDAYMSMEKYKECFNAYSAVLKINPSNISTLNNYAYALSLKRKDLGKALKMSGKTIEAEPNNATYLDTYGWILHQMGRDKAAKDIFKRAMMFGGRKESVILKHYAEVLTALGEKDLASYYETLSEK
ncbi:MAG: hypothetical protein J5764_02855 [Bacteroidales bacterium]|nr:hypothetical protein [Bacteroidales bacterium]